MISVKKFNVLFIQDLTSKTHYCYFKHNMLTKHASKHMSNHMLTHTHNSVAQGSIEYHGQSIECWPLVHLHEDRDELSSNYYNGKMWSTCRSPALLGSL